jgi:hypothetical protein
MCLKFEIKYQDEDDCIKRSSQPVLGLYRELAWSLNLDTIPDLISPTLLVSGKSVGRHASDGNSRGREGQTEGRWPQQTEICRLSLIASTPQRLLGQALSRDNAVNWKITADERT